MASLQTLRNKGGVVLTIFIGLALLAFVLGDLMSSGSVLLGNNNSKIGEIDGAKVTALEYQNQLAQLTEIRKMTHGESQSNEDTEALRNQTWDYLIRVHAFKPALAKCGITVSEAELADLVVGNNISPVIVQFFRDPQTGSYSPQALQQFVANKGQDKTGRMQMFWSYIQQEIADNAQLMKFKGLVDKASYVTKFEAEQMAKLEGTNYAVRFVASKYADIADSTINIADSEIKDFYNQHTKMFKVQTSRTIDYVVFPVLPSSDDYVAAKTYIDQLTEDFQKSTDVMRFAELSSQDPMVDKRYYKEGELNGELGVFAFSKSETGIYGPVLDAEQYTLARIADEKVLPDSISFSHIVLYPEQKATADSLFLALKKGGDFAEAAKKFSADPQSASKGGEVGMFDPQTMAPEFSAPILKAKKGDLITVTTPQSIHIIKVEQVKGESRKVQLAIVKYTIEASEQTRNTIFNNATEFASAASKNFEKIATERTLAKRSAEIGANDNDVQGLTQSSEVASWTYRSKLNNVSEVMDCGGSNFVVATLKKITEEGSAPLEDAKSYIKSHLTLLKKGQTLADKMKGATSVDALAEKLALTPVEASDINITTYVVPEIGFDPAFAGGICGMDASKVSKPIVGLAAVYVAQITGSASEPAPADIVKERMKAENQQRAVSTSFQAFLELCNIKDMRYKMK